MVKKNTGKYQREAATAQGGAEEPPAQVVPEGTEAVRPQVVLHQTSVYTQPPQPPHNNGKSTVWFFFNLIIDFYHYFKLTMFI